MQSLHLKTDGNNVALAQLPLTVVHLDGPIDAESYRRRARGEGPQIALPLAPSGGMRAIVVRGDDDADILEIPGRVLTFVIAGAIRLHVSGEVRELTPGDMLLADGGRDWSHVVVPERGTRLIQLRVSADWPGPAAAVPDPGTPSHAGGGPNLKRMYKGHDDRSRFRPFDKLFDSVAGRTPLRPVTGFRFVSFPDDAFIDWHPEVVNCFVMILSGELELEVGGGGGQIERFVTGDICLAEDRVGEGHIDRTRGFTNVAVVVLENEDLWQL